MSSSFNAFFDFDTNKFNGSPITLNIPRKYLRYLTGKGYRYNLSEDTKDRIDIFINLLLSHGYDPYNPQIKKGGKKNKLVDDMRNFLYHAGKGKETPLGYTLCYVCTFFPIAPIEG